MKKYLLRIRNRVRRAKKPWSVVSRTADFLLTFFLHQGHKSEIKTAYKNYLDGRTTISKVDELVIGSNFLSRGKLRNKIVHDAKLDFDLGILSNLDSVLPDFDIDKCVSELQIDGFTRLPVTLPSKYVEELVELASTSQVRPTKYAKIQGLQDKPNPKIDHIWDVPFATTIQSAACQLLIQDKQLLSLAGKYLQANPIVLGSRLYWSLAHENEEFLTAENWHVDAGDGLRFVKLFVALTDVTESNGPTGFIKGSHISLPRKFYSGRRFHPKEIDKRFRGKLMEATGTIGTIYLADTRGLHRGTPVKQGSRLLLHFFYGTDFFGFARPTTFEMSSDVTFGDRYSGPLARTFAAFRSDSPADSSKIPGP